MRKLFPILLAASVLLSCGDDKKKEDPKPINPIPPHSASVTVDGAAFPLDMARTVAEIQTQNGGALSVTIGVTQPTGPRINVFAYEFRKRVEVIQLSPTHGNGINFDNNNSGYFESRRCNPINHTLEIVEFDETARTVSGKFSGTVCSGNFSHTIVGQFNIPYRVR